jgi:hypothetical protein
MKTQQQMSTLIALFLSSIFVAKSFGADPAPSVSPQRYTHSDATASVNGVRMRFLKVTKPPFPFGRMREVEASQNIKYNAIVKITIDHGKIVRVVPSGGNEALSKYLAEIVQKTWVADPRMTGTFTLPNEFQLQGR